ncbi:MAG: hypothetical protein AB1599_00655 [Planctomycetota bacterium]
MSKKSLLQLGLFTTLIIMVPYHAYSNTGTVVMWAGIAHLFIGNAVIGLIEGLIIGIVFKTSRLLTVPVMIAANYISMWVGTYLFGKMSDKFQHIVTIYNAAFILAALIIVSFLFTFILEWPFCLFLFRKQEKKIKRSLLANLITQSISYVLLIAFYALPSGASLITDVKIDKTLSFATTQKMWIYYISTDNGDIYRIRQNGASNEKILDANITDKFDGLFLRPSNDTPYSNLCVTEGRGDRILIPHFTAESMIPYYPEKDEQPSWFKPIDLRPVDQQDWDVSVGFWAIEGLRAKNKVNGKKFRLAMETPFVSMSIRNITLLPSNQAVFQINDNQIALLDLNSRKLGLIITGRGPLVIMEK